MTDTRYTQLLGEYCDILYLFGRLELPLPESTPFTSDYAAKDYEKHLQSTRILVEVRAAQAGITPVDYLERLASCKAWQAALQEVAKHSDAYYQAIDR
jgi:hypothetical protein